MHRIRRLVYLALTILLVAPLSSTGDQEGQFGDTTDVVLVQIPVHVTLKGEPVRGLQASDFEVLEGRKKQKIVAMDVFDLELLDESDLTAQVIPPAARRNFLFLFDLSNAVPAGVIRAQEAAFEVADGALHPSDLAGVATYSQANGLEVLLGFTPDRAQLLATLSDLGLVDPHLRVSDPLRLTMLELRDTLAQEGLGGADDDGDRPGRPNADAVYLEVLKDLSTFTTRGNRDILKEQITDLAVELDELALLLDSVTGRKQVVFFSQGFDSEVVFGTRDAARIQEITDDVAFGEIWKVDSEERFGAGDAQTTLMAMLESLRRSDCAVHTVDTGGLRAGGSTTASRFNAESADLTRTHDGLFMVANQTGGEFYRNTNDLGEAMDNLMDQTSVTYVLSIQPQNQLDGSYHPLKVRLRKKSERGLDISHRAGYYARRAYSELEPAERQMSTAELIVSGPEGGSILTDVLAAPFGTDDDEAYVLTAVEINGDSLLRGQVDNVVPAEVYTYAFDEAGRVRDFFTQAVGLDLYKVGYRLQNGFKLLSHLSLPPGRYELRTLVRNAGTGATGLTRTAIEVPDFHAGSPVLLPPFFIESEDRWLVGDGKRDGREDEAYPLMSRGSRLVPASHPMIPVGQRVPMLLVGTHLPEGARVEAAFRPIGTPGEPRRFEVDLGNRSSDLSGVDRMTAHLRTSGLRAGEYELLLTLTGADGSAVTSSIPVSVIDSTF